MVLAKEHVVVLGATGMSGIQLIKEVLKLGSNGPHVTLYTRSSARSKLPAEISGRSNIRVVEGALDDRNALLNAMSADTKSGFPKATSVIGLLGAPGLSFYHLITRRRGPTPIADAFSSSILPVMREVGVHRILALSTLSGFQYPEEKRKMDWSTWLKMLPPKIMVPQGDAEMGGIANAVVVEGASNPALEWTVFRVPFLHDKEPKTPLSVGEHFMDFRGSQQLSRISIARWLLSELEERKHIRKAPLLGNMAA
ncbi:uncharacterized protein AB675_11149 [Cyphellophora attinorum]|uniref:NAD(P)-binding domain-containing protein n=1 Tax=Cyphellophora attinorum TaxID=1664694 RepID=A0A0N1NXU4_9EURO|nr:uncharacterized protein AB675_11149 [Phialophora attinorum]KPI35857.1 hypothetical protein AB675_11149 [Phialophora attinorum]